MNKPVLEKLGYTKTYEITTHRNTHMSNPYQIRTDLLAMSKEMLDKAYDTQLQCMPQWNSIKTLKGLKAWKDYVPKICTQKK